jgi:hypothetical protein
MHMLGTVVLLFGVFILIASQLYVTVMTFKVDAMGGVLCFVIPGYALFVAKRNGFYGKFFAAYLAGIVGIIVGGSILS